MTDNESPPLTEALERWHNSGGFHACDESQCFDAVYTLAAAYAAEHPPEDSATTPPPVPASEGIDALAAELCRQHEVSEMGGSWGKAAVKSLIEKHLPSLAASESARLAAERERDRYSNQFGDCMDKLGNWQRVSGCSHPAALEKKLSAAEQSAAAMREALTEIDARCCDASSRVPAIGLLSGPERALCDVHTIARAALASQPENRE